MIEHIVVLDEEVTIRIMQEEGISFGELSFYKNYKDEVWLYNLSVRKKHRSKGFGNAMLQYVISRAKELGCSTLHLKAEEDSWMENWYINKGFIPYYKEDGYTNLVLRLN